MQMMFIYRVLTYILLIFAFFWAMAVIFLINVAFAYPALLLTLFVVASVVLYTFSSFQFLRRGIDRGGQFKKSRKDFIKVNAYVTVFFAVINFVQAFIGITKPNKLQVLLQQVQTMQPGASGLNTSDFVSSVNIVLWVMLIYTVALGIHIYQTFHLLRQHVSLFADPQERSDS
jgi:hypothetical protein